MNTSDHTGDMSPEWVRFEGISHKAFQHPADRAAMTALRSIPGFDRVLRTIIRLVGERSMRIIHLGSAARVGPKQFASLNRIFDECLEVLDVPERPEVFVAHTPFVNAGAVGIDNPFIVIGSASLGHFDEKELRVVLGHELGHLLCGHALYKTVLALLVRLSPLAMNIPMGMVALATIIAALKEWERKSELSADRASLLVAQDPQLCFRVHMKLAGGSRVDEMSVDEFARQAKEYQAGGDVWDSLLKLLNTVGQSHPFPVMRLDALGEWVDRGEYEAVLAGDYPRRTDDDSRSIVDELKASARSYRERYEESQDPLTRMFKDLGASVSSVGERVKRRFGT